MKVEVDIMGHKVVAETDYEPPKYGYDVRQTEPLKAAILGRLFNEAHGLGMAYIEKMDRTEVIAAKDGTAKELEGIRAMVENLVHIVHRQADAVERIADALEARAMLDAPAKEERRSE